MGEFKFRYIFEDIKEDGRILVTQIWNLNDIEINDIVYDTEVLIARNQYIGRKDNNNVEIYEGDICKIKYSKDSQKYSLCEESVGLVEYFDSSFWLNNKKDKFSVIIDISEELEVIGSIYENPELLKED